MLSQLFLIFKTVTGYLGSVATNFYSNIQSLFTLPVIGLLLLSLTLLNFMFSARLASDYLLLLSFILLLLLLTLFILELSWQIDSVSSPTLQYKNSKDESSRRGSARSGKTAILEKEQKTKLYRDRTTESDTKCLTFDEVAEKVILTIESDAFEFNNGWWSISIYIAHPSWSIIPLMQGVYTYVLGKLTPKIMSEPFNYEPGKGYEVLVLCFNQVTGGNWVFTHAPSYLKLVNPISLARNHIMVLIASTLSNLSKGVYSPLQSFNVIIIPFSSIEERYPGFKAMSVPQKNKLYQKLLVECKTKLNTTNKKNEHI